MALPLLIAASASSWSLTLVVAGLGGLLVGVLLMASLSTDWQRLPQHLRLWTRALRAQSGWAILAVGSLGVLVFY